MKKFSIFNFQFSIKKGFTLIELLVVIVIIGILATFLMANYIGVRARGRDVQRKSDLLQVQAALEMYRSDQEAYPANAAGDGNFQFPASCATVTAFKSADANTTYMQKIPCDPTNSGELIYDYQVAAGNLTYTLTACLENVNDQQKDNPNVAAKCNGTSHWSYTLTNP